MDDKQIAEIEARHAAGRGDQDVPALLAEVRATRVDAAHWHDTYQQHAGAVDEFFGELLKLLPGAEDEGMDAYDQIPRGIERLRARLKAAEDLCVMYSWSAAHAQTNREKAAHELWRRWYQIVGSDFLLPEAHPDLSDEEVARLAAQRDETRARTLARIRSDAPAELPGGER